MGYLKALKEQFNAIAAWLTAGDIPPEPRTTWVDEDMVPAPNFEHRINFEHCIIEKLKGKPGGVSVVEVWASLGAQRTAKTEFDQAVLSLYKEGRVYLDRHDHPLRLSDADRRDLVFDGTVNYYVGITLRGDFD